MVAFARMLDEKRRVVIAVPRQVLTHVEPWSGSWLASAFGRTRLKLAEGEYTSISGEGIKGPEVSLAAVWRELPVAVLVPAGRA